MHMICILIEFMVSIQEKEMSNQITTRINDIIMKANATEERYMALCEEDWPGEAGQGRGPF